MERIVGNTTGWTREVHDGALADYDAWGAAEGKCFLTDIANKWGIHYRDVRVLAASNGRRLYRGGVNRSNWLGKSSGVNPHWELAQVYHNQGYKAYKEAENGSYFT